MSANIISFFFFHSAPIHTNPVLSVFYLSMMKCKTTATFMTETIKLLDNFVQEACLCFHFNTHFNLFTEKKKFCLFFLNVKTSAIIMFLYLSYHKSVCGKAACVFF